MTKSLDIFEILSYRNTQTFKELFYKKVVQVMDKRIIGQYLQKFIEYNLELFEFLGVQPSIIGIIQSIALTFRTTAFIGSIPLRAP